MNHIRQINLLIKRILCRPAMIVVLLVIPAVLIAVSFLPARKQSTEIVSGVYIESSDEHTDAFLSYLTSTSTGFTFRHYESLKDMKDDVASGRIDSAYMVPDSFSESMIHSDGKRHITVYTTDGSSFQSVSEESRVCRPPVCICGRHVCMYAPGSLSGKCPIRRDPDVRMHQ